MDGLEAVADVGQRARDDDAHRVVEVAHPHLVLDADRPDVAEVVGHGAGLRSVGVWIWAGSLPWRSVGVAAGAARRCTSLTGATPWDGRRGPAAHRSARTSRPRPRSTGRRAAAGRRRRASDLGGVGGIELGEGVADDPGARAVGGRRRDARLVATEPGDRGPVHEREGAERPRERLLHVGLRVADEQPDDVEAARRDRRCTAPGPVDERDAGDGRADEPALPARRRVDELLELRPAVRLGEDAPGARRGERVDGDPLARGRRHPPDELPRALGIGRDDPVGDVDGEPPHLRDVAPRRPVGEREEPCRGGRAGSPAGSPPRRRRGAARGPRARP